MSDDEELNVEFENDEEFDEQFDIDADDETDLDVDIEAEPFRSADHTPETAPGDDPLEVFDTPDDEPLDDDVFDEMDTGSEFDDADVFDLIEEEPESDADSDLLELQEVEAVDEGVIVPKSQYCEQCEHFSAPPEMACENSGTTIHELTDLEHVRVTDCPIVTERTQMRSRDAE
ncbi:hypothetical protein [Halosegnis longus]|uniref:hypothetical protein n=1 Tax=Halosegnis longus TaxID=2216012 RepID=UPI00096AC18A|nr:hypothetical protein [Salella cibi]